MNKSAEATHFETLVLAMQSPKSINLNICITPVTSLKPLVMTALLDSGAMGMLINRDFVQKNNLEMTPLTPPIPVQNIDGSPNEHGPITEEVEVILHYREHSERVHLTVANIGQQPLIICHPWLLYHNPEINWRRQEVSMSCCPPKCQINLIDFNDQIFFIPCMSLGGMETVETTISVLDQTTKEEKPLEDLILEHTKTTETSSLRMGSMHSPPKKILGPHYQAHPWV